MKTEASYIRHRDTLNNQDIALFLGKAEQDVLKHKGIRHPFLIHFSQDDKPLNNKPLFLEFYYFIHHLPFYIAGMSLNTRDEKVLRELAINLAEEVGERNKKPHLDIYRDFLESIGINQSDINAYQCHENTNKIDAGIKHLYTEADTIISMGAMYALETMSSQMVSLLNDGLKSQHYDKKVRGFFELHIISEKGHSNGVYNVVASYLNNEADRLEFQKGASEFMTLIEQFWDGVQESVQSYRH